MVNMTMQKDLANEVLKYLEKHPESGDTLEGIATWWLRQQRIDESVELIQHVLNELKDGGVVRERKSSHGRTVYFYRQGE